MPRPPVVPRPVANDPKRTRGVAFCCDARHSINCIGRGRGIKETDHRYRRSLRARRERPRGKQCADLLTSRRQDDGLAGRLGVEEPVGLLGLLEPPAVREEPLHVHVALGDELGALGLALLRGRLSLFAPARRAAGEGLKCGGSTQEN